MPAQALLPVPHVMLVILVHFAIPAIQMQDIMQHPMVQLFANHVLMYILIALHAILLQTV